MDQFHFHFDDYLDLINAQEVKALARLSTISQPTRKAECIEIVQEANDPEKVRTAVASLAPWERNALALLHMLGGMISYQTLGISLQASGFLPTELNKGQPLTPRPDNTPVSRIADEQLSVQSQLFQRIFLVNGLERYPVDLRKWLSPGQTVNTASGGHPNAFASARPASLVALDLLGLLQAIDHQNGLEF